VIQKKGPAINVNGVVSLPAVVEVVVVAGRYYSDEREKRTGPALPFAIKFLHRTPSPPTFVSQPIITQRFIARLCSPVPLL